MPSAPASLLETDTGVVLDLVSANATGAFPCTAVVTSIVIHCPALNAPVEARTVAVGAGAFA